MTSLMLLLFLTILLKVGLLIFLQFYMFWGKDDELVEVDTESGQLVEPLLKGMKAVPT